MERGRTGRERLHPGSLDRRRQAFRAVSGKRPAAYPDLRHTRKTPGGDLVSFGRIGQRPARGVGQERSLLHFLLVRDAHDDLSLRRLEGDPRSLGEGERPGRGRPLRGQAGQVRLQGRHADPDVPRPPEGVEARRVESDAPDRIRRLQSLGDAGLLGPRRALGRERRGVRAPQSARRRRVRRGLAQGRDAREKAERLRRLHRRGAVADLERIHVPFQARDLGRLQRRTARGRGLDTTPGPLRRGRLLLSASRHGALSEVPSRGLRVPEYGSGDNPEQFPFLYAYSPYHHVKAGTKYPAVLFITGDSDTRVAPLHARKMTALLQASTGSDRPILLHYDTKAGHSGGATPVTKRIEDLSDELSFLFAETGARLQPAAAKPPARKKAA